MSETTLREDRWRVKKFVVQVPTQAVTARPWQLQAPVPAPLSYTSSVWGVWPPQWSLGVPPLLLFPNWEQSFRAAFDRAQFAAVPPESVQSTFVQQLEAEYPSVIPPFRDDLFREEDTNGQA